jgi:hypothetical protein
MSLRLLVCSSFLFVLVPSPAHSQQKEDPAAAPIPSSPAVVGVKRLTPGAKIFIDNMGGYGPYLATAIVEKKVPLVVVADAALADFLVTGNSHVERGGWVRSKLITPDPKADAFIEVKDAKSGVVVFTDSVKKFDAPSANLSTANVCAKHLKDAIEKR